MDLVIIGGGPAGLSAAIRAKEEGVRDVLVIERNALLGGILNQCIHHGFGLHIFKEELTGPEYAQRLIDRAQALGVQFALNTMVIRIAEADVSSAQDKTVNHNKIITAVSPEGIVQIPAGALILAMGCRERARGALGIPGDRGCGVYTAGTAQALVNMKGFLPGKRVVVLGSGDIGLIMARRMTLEGAKVLGVYEIMPYSGGLKRNIAQCLDDYHIPLMLSHTVTRIVGRTRLEGVYVAAVDENRHPLPETEQWVPCDTLLLSVGLIPENELSRQLGILLSPITGGAVVNSHLETNIPGVFSCGNVLHVHDLADNVTLEAYEAGRYAAAYLRGALPDGQLIQVQAGKGVRYASPSSLVFGNDTPNRFNIMFRSDNIYPSATITVYADTQPIKTVKKRVVTPGEMESVTFTADTCPEKITVCVASNR